MRVAWLCTLVLATSYANAQDSYLCIADQTTGFIYDKNLKSWKQTTFKAGDRYLLTRASKQGSWILKKFGEQHAMAECGQFNTAGNLLCGDGGADFRMNRDNLRFLYVFPHGYWFNKNPKVDEDGDTPYIEIGKCGGLG